MYWLRAFCGATGIRTALPRVSCTVQPERVRDEDNDEQFEAKLIFYCEAIPAVYDAITQTFAMCKSRRSLREWLVGHPFGDQLSSLFYQLAVSYYRCAHCSIGHRFSVTAWRAQQFNTIYRIMQLNVV
jgi:hypothetical protein